MPRFRISEIKPDSCAFSKTTALAFKSANNKTNEQRQNLRLPLLICIYFCGPRRGEIEVKRKRQEVRSFGLTTHHPKLLVLQSPCGTGSFHLLRPHALRPRVTLQVSRGQPEARYKHQRTPDCKRSYQKPANHFSRSLIIRGKAVSEEPFRSPLTDKQRANEQHQPNPRGLLGEIKGDANGLVLVVAIDPHARIIAIEVAAPFRVLPF